MGEFQVRQGRKTLYGLLNAAGDIVLEAQPNMLFVLPDNKVMLFRNKRIKGDKDRILNLGNGTICSVKEYDAQNFGGNIQWRGKGYCVVDINGNIIIPYKYRMITIRGDVFLALNLKNKYGLLDSCGNELIPFEYDRMDVGDTLDYIAVCKNGEWYYVN